MPIARVGPEFLVNFTTQNYQSTPVVAQLADGRIIFAFSSQDFAGDEFGQLHSHPRFRLRRQSVDTDPVANSTGEVTSTILR